MVVDCFRIPRKKKKNTGNLLTPVEDADGTEECKGEEIDRVQVEENEQFGKILWQRVFFPLAGCVKSQEQREGVRTYYNIRLAGASGRKSRANEKRVLQQQQKESGVTLRSCPGRSLGFLLCVRRARAGETHPPIYKR